MTIDATEQALRTEAELPTAYQQALNVWRSKLSDLTLSEAQHAEAHRMIDMILGKGLKWVPGKMNEIVDRMKTLENSVEVALKKLFDHMGNLESRVNELESRVDELTAELLEPRTFDHIQTAESEQQSTGLKQEAEPAISTPPVPSLPGEPKTPRQKAAAERSDRVNKAIDEKVKRFKPDDDRPTTEQATAEQAKTEVEDSEPVKAKKHIGPKTDRPTKPTKKPAKPPAKKPVKAKPATSKAVSVDDRICPEDELPEWALPKVSSD